MNGQASRPEMPTDAPRMVPALMIKRGRAVTPGPDGPQNLEDPNGHPVDLLDLADALIAEHGRLYVIDLDGIDRDSPQLDYLQEMSRDGELWVDAGIRTADQAIDVLIAGASRAVLSSSALDSPEEVARAWALSPDVVFELDASSPALDGVLPGWSMTPDAAAQRVRSLGPQEIVYRFPPDRPEWEPFRRIASAGPAWAAGPIVPSDLERITAAHGVGGIFQYGVGPETLPPPPSAPTARAQDDEN
jgi:hypothetical protein